MAPEPHRNDNRQSASRRDILRRIAATGAIGIAGCASDPDTGTATDAPTMTTRDSILTATRTPTESTEAGETATETPPGNITPTGRGTPDSLQWPVNQALPQFPETDHLDVADIRSLSATEKIFMATLQGIVNRRQTRLYLLKSTEEGARAWLDPLDVEYTVREPGTVIEDYLDEIEGIITYDLVFDDSINIATTLAGLADAPIIDSFGAERFVNEYDLNVIADLSGRFNSRLKAYRWLVNNYWKHTTNRMLVGLQPQLSDFRDYVVANRAMVVWLNPGVEADRALLGSLLEDMPTNAPYMGWFPSGVAGEFSGVEMCAEHSAYVAPSDFFENMSALSGVRMDPTPAAAPSPPEPPPLENKVYMMIVMSDGDNLQYDQHRLRVLWDQDARGEVPINWSISPLLVDAAPGMLAYYHRTATENDVLMCGPSGAGYTYPAPWPDDTFGTFTEQTGRYMKTAGLHTMYLLNREGGQDVPLSETVAEAYATDVDPGGIYLPAGTSDTWIRTGDLVQSVGPYTSSVDRFVEVIRENTPGGWDGSQPAFVSIGVITWDMDTADVVAAVEQLGEAYEPVRADHFFDLYRRYGAEMG